MNQTIVPTDNATPIQSDVGPLDRHPAVIYLAGLSKGGRRTMRQALDVMAGLLTGEADCPTVAPWGAVLRDRGLPLAGRRG